MIKSYEDSVAYLLKSGWVLQKPGAYQKGSHTVVFDTSHYVEIYNSNGQRVAETPVESVQDLIELLQRIGI